MINPKFEKPKTLNGLLFLAIEDFKKALKDPKCKIDMDTWYSGTGRGRCKVCLAGSVLRYSLRLKLGKGISLRLLPTDIDNPWPSYLRAINRLRVGHINAGWFYFYGGDKKFPKDLPHWIDIPPYDGGDTKEKAEEFIENLTALAICLWLIEEA